MVTREPTEVVSRYLEAIYYVLAEGEAVRPARLADWLGVSRPTVTSALRRMIRDDMIRFNSRREVELTDAGEQAASAIVRRHRIMERWLTDVLGMDWVGADMEAARLEHAVSDRVAQRLYETLGSPATCPHGNPIPGYSEASAEEVKLSGIGAGALATVARISEVAEREAPVLLGYLFDRQLVPGAELTVLEIDPVAGVVRVQIGKSEITLGRETSDKVWVVPRAAVTAGP